MSNAPSTASLQPEPLPVLEHSSLTIEPFVLGPAGLTRLIRDGDTCEPLGRALQHPDGRRWTDWLKPAPLVIREFPDDSLLCVLYHSWFSHSVLVHDAEGSPIADVRRRRILNPHGLLLARRYDMSGQGSFRDIRHVELACWQDRASAVRLRFRPSVQNEPLTKMAILAAMLKACRYASSP